MTKNIQKLLSYAADIEKYWKIEKICYFKIMKIVILLQAKYDIL